MKDRQTACTGAPAPRGTEKLSRVCPACEGHYKNTNSVETVTQRQDSETRKEDENGNHNEEQEKRLRRKFIYLVLNLVIKS